MSDSFSLVKLPSKDGQKCIECCTFSYNSTDYVEVLYSPETGSVVVAFNLEQNENFISTDYYTLQHPTKPVAGYTVRDVLDTVMKKRFEVVDFECDERPDVTSDTYIDMLISGAPHAIFGLVRLPA